MYSSVFRTILQNNKQVCYARARPSQYKLGSTCDLKFECLPGTLGTEGKQSPSSFTAPAGDDILWRFLFYPCFFKVRYSLLKRNKSKHRCVKIVRALTQEGITF